MREPAALQPWQEMDGRGRSEWGRELGVDVWRVPMAEIGPTFDRVGAIYDAARQKTADVIARAQAH